MHTTKEECIMAIYDHKYGELAYFRVFRAWGGKEYQEYVRIKRSRKAAYAKAKQIDDKLAREQQAFHVEQARAPAYHIRSDGKIRGLRRITVKRKGRTPTEVFELRINVPWENEIRRTTISITVHGEEEAFRQAIDKIVQWYAFGPDSNVRAAMMACCNAYRAPVQKIDNVAELALKKARDEIVHLTDGLVKSLKRFTA
jgi:hypothetical protein